MGGEARHRLNMDPGNGNLYPVADEADARKRGLVPVNRGLSRNERRAMRIGPNSPCGCGSGLKFKRCCLRTSPPTQEMV